jgi:Carboxypeptidase regulatory-like domain
LRRLRWISILGNAALVTLLGPSFVAAQEPVTPLPPPPRAAPSPSGSSSSKLSKKKHSHANDFLIRGTVLNEQALSFPSVQLRIRRAGEKKFQWETYTNSRGEFAVRVPQGADYEMVVRAKGFAEQKRAIDAKTGDYEGNLVFRMMHEGGDKK